MRNSLFYPILVLFLALASLFPLSEHVLAQKKPFKADLINVSQSMSGDRKYIYLDVKLTGEKSRPRFEVYEEGKAQTIVDVTKKERPSRLVDIVFLMDNSGSMEEEQEAVNRNVERFVEKLSREANFDFRLGLCRFGARENQGFPLIENRGELVDTAGQFKELWEKNTIDDIPGFEPGWDALHKSAKNFNFRAGASKVFILITDESVTGHTSGPSDNIGKRGKRETAEVLKRNSVTVFSVVDKSRKKSEEDYCRPFMGKSDRCIDISHSFKEIFADISRLFERTYRVIYKSDLECEDNFQDVRVAVGSGGSSVELEGSYPCKILQISQLSLNQDQKKIPAREALIEEESVQVKAKIEGGESPYEVTLYYKGKEDSVFSSTIMERVSDQQYRAKIPAGAVDYPRMSYYLKAQGGTSVASYPLKDPSQNPKQMAVRPNKKPRIVHQEIAIADPDLPLTVSASVSDDTDGVEDVRLYYRKSGRLLYQSVAMEREGDNYSARIPEEFVTGDGIDYYLEAEDNFGVRSYHGTGENPHRIYAPLLEVKIDKDEGKFRINLERKGWGPLDRGVKIDYQEKLFRLLNSDREPIEGKSFQGKQCFLELRETSLEPGFYQGKVRVTPLKEKIVSQGETSFPYQVALLSLERHKLPTKNLWVAKRSGNLQDGKILVKYEDLRLKALPEDWSPDLLFSEAESSHGDLSLETHLIEQGDKTFDLQLEVGPLSLLAKLSEDLNRTERDGYVTLRHKPLDEGELLKFKGAQLPIDLTYWEQFVEVKVVEDNTDDTLTYGDKAFCLDFRSNRGWDEISGNGEIELMQGGSLNTGLCDAEGGRLSGKSSLKIPGKDSSRSNLVCFYVCEGLEVEKEKKTYRGKIALSPSSPQFKLEPSLKNDDTYEYEYELRISPPQLESKVRATEKGLYVELKRRNYAHFRKGVEVVYPEDLLMLKDGKKDNFTGENFFLRLKDLAPGVYDGRVSVRPKSPQAELKGDLPFDFKATLLRVSREALETPNLYAQGEEKIIWEDLKIQGFSDRLDPADINLEVNSKISGLNITSATLKHKGGNSFQLALSVPRAELREMSEEQRQRLIGGKEDALIKFRYEPSDTQKGIVKFAGRNVPIDLKYRRTLIKIEEILPPSQGPLLPGEEAFKLKLEFGNLRESERELKLKKGGGDLFAVFDGKGNRLRQEAFVRETLNFKLRQGVEPGVYSGYIELKPTAPNVEIESNRDNYRYEYDLSVFRPRLGIADSKRITAKNSQFEGTLNAFEVNLEREGFKREDIGKGVTIEGWKKHFELFDGQWKRIDGQQFKGNKFYLKVNRQRLEPGIYEGKIKLLPGDERLTLEKSSLNYKVTVLAISDETFSLNLYPDSPNTIKDVKIEGLSETAWSWSRLKVKAKSRHGLEIDSDVRNAASNYCDLRFKIEESSQKLLKERIKGEVNESKEDGEIVFKYKPSTEANNLVVFKDSVPLDLSYLSATIKQLRKGTFYGGGLAALIFFLCLLGLVGVSMRRGVSIPEAGMFLFYESPWVLILTVSSLLLAAMAFVLRFVIYS